MSERRGPRWGGGPATVTMTYEVFAKWNERLEAAEAAVEVARQVGSEQLLGADGFRRVSSDLLMRLGIAVGAYDDVCALAVQCARGEHRVGETCGNPSCPTCYPPHVDCSYLNLCAGQKCPVCGLLNGTIECLETHWRLR